MPRVHRPPTGPGVGMTEAEVDQLLVHTFPGQVAVSNGQAFKCLNISTSYGHLLLAAGVLRRVHLGRLSRVSVSSIRELLLNGVSPEVVIYKRRKLARPRK